MWSQKMSVMTHSSAQLCPIIAKSQRAPNAQLTCLIVNRHYEELKSCCADSQTLKNPYVLYNTFYQILGPDSTRRIWYVCHVQKNFS